ncbi:MAG: Asp23/Gls24 family envelope stress response protein [Anaerolineae bacterium]|nr:Asp23/Gls24 family envelope stress response protein [Anaerolineae bacterium]
METQPVIPGKITVDPQVLETIARLTANRVPGVAKIAEKTDVERFLGLGAKSVLVRVSEGRVSVDLHIMAEPGVSLLRVGRAVQQEVTESVQQMIGMPVDAVNVYIEDIFYLQPQEEVTAD